MASTLALPVPPPQHPFLPSTHNARVWCRVYPFDAAAGKYVPAAFNHSGLGWARFSPLWSQTTGEPIATIYACSSVNAATRDVLLLNVPTPSTGYLHDLQRDYAAGLVLSRARTPTLCPSATPGRRRHALHRPARRDGRRRRLEAGQRGRGLVDRRQAVVRPPSCLCGLAESSGLPLKSFDRCNSS